MPLARTSYMAHRDGEVPDADDPLLAFTPVPHVAPRRNSIGPERQRAFVAHLAACGIVRQAARHIGASLEALYKLRHKPGAEEFAAAWDAAVDRGILRIEDGALQRAIEGAERPIVSSGRLLGSYRVHNEGLVMFLLRQRRPERYGAELSLTVKPGHPVYERVRREVLGECRASDEDVLEAIDRAIEEMRQRRLANKALSAGWAAGGEDPGEAGDGQEQAGT